MRKSTLFAAVFLSTVLVNCAGCSAFVVPKEPLPEDTIEAFEDAVNDMDVQAMMDCMDDKAVKALTTGMDVIMNIAGGLTGVDLGISAEDLIHMMPLMQGLSETYASEMGYPQVDFQVTETFIKGDKATVYFVEAGSGEQAVINMKKSDGQWKMVLDTKLITAQEADRVLIAGEETEENEDVDTEKAALSFSVLDLLDSEKVENLLRVFLESLSE